MRPAAADMWEQAHPSVDGPGRPASWWTGCASRS